MFDSSSVIVGLEIGTSKVCAVVGEMNAEGVLNIIGIGQSRSRGVRKGEVVDHGQAEEDVRAAIVEAERMADVEIRSVQLGVTGGHMRGFTNRGVHPVVSADREICEDDLQDVIKNAKAINLAADHSVVHAVRQNFIVDGQEGISDPTGMLGSRLEVDVHVVHGTLNRLQNPVRVVKGLQLDVDAVVFSGLACSLSLLSSEQKELGALVVDIGGGTTEYAVYVDGVIKHTGVLAVGGDHISNDLAYGLKVPLGRAEQLKLEHGSAFADEPESELTLPGGVGQGPRVISRRNLLRIMSMRVEEILQLVASDIEAAGFADHVRTGVFLSGGGARIPRIAELAAHVFEIPAYVGRANSISGLKSALDQPEFSTSIGLVKFGSFQHKRRSNGRPKVGGMLSSFGRLFG
jgi:cell division protein FtsA